MARATFVKKARKAHPEAGIKKGESYWHWSFRVGSRFVKRYSKTQPKRSQLTQSAFLSAMYDIEDSLDDEVKSFLKGENDFEGLASACEDAASQVRDTGEECESSRSNMPEGLQDGETGQLLEQRYDQCNSIADELESAASDIRDLQPEKPEDDEKDGDTTNEDARDEAAEVVGNINWEYE